MPENTITIVGNLTADPELRFTQNGAAVANVTIASTHRVYDKQSQQWKDGDALFMRGTIWKEAAEHIADSLHKGVRVIATGKLKQRSWEDNDGNKRTSVEMEIEEIGPSLKFNAVTVESRQRNGGSTYGNGGSSAPTSDPWSNDDSPF